MTINDADKNLRQQLELIYDNREALNITNLIMEKLTGFSKSLRIVYKQKVLTLDQQKKLSNYENELNNHKPVQYVLQEAWFAGMKFYVDENVLIPRPETEELTEQIIHQSLNEKLKIIDIGTGSGCIAIALKKKLSNATVYAIDISSKALEIASKNASQNNVEIHFNRMNILHLEENIALPLFDIIVSNPPYIRQSEAREMKPNVLLYEPEIALFVPDRDPLCFYKAIADFALKFLTPNNGKLFFEINESLGKDVVNLLKEKKFSSITIQKDLQGKNRMVLAFLKNEKK
ncbi:MAG: peptide chain release factor N(5)-glutamine methyltransferase [Bacteroidetes bacterium]|nr:peptide chain release factor N(5)-glutamine methyltransferase [Bacteroidota bacterium]